MLIFVLFSMACGGEQRPAAVSPESADGAQAEQAPQAATAPAPGGAPADDLAERRDMEGSAEEEFREFERARLELSRVLGRDLGPSSELAAAPPREESEASSGAAPPAPARSRAPAAADEGRAPAEKPKALKKGGDSCELVCRAFGSLARSAAAVCRIDGQTDRCRRASSVVDVAEADPGVRSCGCKR